MRLPINKDERMLDSVGVSLFWKHPYTQSHRALHLKPIGLIMAMITTAAKPMLREKQQ